LTDEQIDHNVRSVRDQLSRYLDLAPAGEWSTEGNQGLVLNNADWIRPLNYVEFLRDVGRHFSVNRMLTADSVRLRLESESGLSFLEFNYSLLQAYDFLVLHQRANCTLQLGGSDQWGNIVAGVDLIRRIESRPAHGITFPLIMTSSGKKMGKTEKGALWLDPNRTSPYDYYQYWINVDDADVGRFLRLFTLLPIEEVQELDKLEGADIRRAKEVLAMEATRLTHGDEEAHRARDAAKSLFSGTASGDSVPTYEIAESALSEGVPLPALFADCGLCESKGAARRMAKQGGLYVNGNAAEPDRVVTKDDIEDDAILLRAGKKKHRKVLIV
ncbi:MAG: tyrosine--tRNA ligase, partial [Planctomycetota bacterium]